MTSDRWISAKTSQLAHKISLTDAVEDGVELVVLTLWESMDAAGSFLEREPDKAVVDPDAIAAKFDARINRAIHYQ